MKGASFVPAAFLVGEKVRRRSVIEANTPKARLRV